MKRVKNNEVSQLGIRIRSFVATPRLYTYIHIYIYIYIYLCANLYIITPNFIAYLEVAGWLDIW